MSESLFGALVGGLIALGGIWLSFWLQRREDARVLRATIVAELEAGRDAFTRRGRADPILEMLEGWESSGKEPHARIIGESLKMDPSAAFPVYYARAGDLGCLGVSDASAIVSYYAEAMGLLRSAQLILSEISLEVNTSAAARQLRIDYLRMVSGRNELIGQLRRVPGPAPQDRAKLPPA